MESLSFLAVFALIIYLNNSLVSNYNRLGYLILVLGVLFGLHWVFNSLHNIGELPLYFVIPATLLLAIYVASFYAFALFIAKKYKFTPVEVAAIVTLFEWTKSFLFTGFPWIEIGTLSLNTPLVNYAPIFGTYAVTFFATLLVVYMVNKQNTRSIIKISLILLFGLLLQFFNFTKPVGEKIKVALIQGNVNQQLKFNPDLERINVEKHLSILKKISHKNHISAVVFPETAFVRPLELMDPLLLEKLSKTLIKTNSLLMTGMPTLEKNDWYNSLVVLKPDLKAKYFFRKIGEYRKRHLVPFGEFIPTGFNWFVKMMNIPLGNFSEGKPTQPSINIHGQNIAINICFEDLFNSEIIQSFDNSKNGIPNILLNVSNLGWFGKSNSLHYHLMAARMRSIETERPYIRATNTGVTAYIDHKGKLKAVAPIVETSYLLVDIQGREGLTPFSKFGNSPILLLCLFILCSNLVRRKFL